MVEIGGSKAEWWRAWHGSSMKSVYVFHPLHGRMSASWNAQSGHTFFPGLRGVYFHGDRTMEKAENYMVFIPMLQKHICWGVKWECLVDTSERVAIGKRASTDQWIQKEKSVQVFALWVCAKSSGDMPDGCSVKVTGFREKDPMKHQFLESVEKRFWDIPRNDEADTARSAESEETKMTRCPRDSPEHGVNDGYGTLGND